MDSNNTKPLEPKDYIKPYSFKLIFAWYDLWIGLFVDKKKKLIYVFPVPMLGIRFKYGYLKYEPQHKKPCYRTLRLKSKPVSTHENRENKRGNTETISKNELGT